MSAPENKPVKPDAQLWKIGRIVPYSSNARTHSEEQVRAISESIKRFGFVNPILVDPSGTIIAGHGRHQAAQLLGLKTVPVIVVNGLSDSERRALTLADNRIAELSGWDTDLLRLELEALKLDDFDLDLTGFDDLAVERYLAAGQEVDSPDQEWKEMPQFKHEDKQSKFKAIVHFRDEDDLRAFEQLVGQAIPENTKSIWYPKQERDVVRGVRY